MSAIRIAQMPTARKSQLTWRSSGGAGKPSFAGDALLQVSVLLLADLPEALQHKEVGHKR